MAKKKRGSAGFRAIRIKSSITLGALADGVVLSAGPIGGTTFADRTYVISTDLRWAISGHTAGEGPLVVGVSHSDYSDAEVEEALEAQNALRSDKIAQEQGR